MTSTRCYAPQYRRVIHFKDFPRNSKISCEKRLLGSRYFKFVEQILNLQKYVLTKITRNIFVVVSHITHII